MSIRTGAFGPIVIGGSEGSGTRLVSEILIQSGVYLGQDFNEANDNLLFVYIFKHPHLFAKDLDYIDPIHKRLYSLHEKLLFGNKPNNINEIRIIFRCAWEHVYNFRHYSWKWVLRRWKQIVRSKHVVNPFTWGWKAPLSVFFT